MSKPRYVGSWRRKVGVGEQEGRDGMIEGVEGLSKVGENTRVRSGKFHNKRSGWKRFVFGGYYSDKVVYGNLSPATILPVCHCSPRREKTHALAKTRCLRILLALAAERTGSTCFNSRCLMRKNRELFLIPRPPFHPKRR